MRYVSFDNPKVKNNFMFATAGEGGSYVCNNELITTIQMRINNFSSFRYVIPNDATEDEIVKIVQEAREEFKKFKNGFTLRCEP